ncbi:MAG: hypothetical protein J0H68_03580 [Sphingobacteriia bacterium]|nr:hypothetical protein [Sphingobacteriia bacterium]
MSKLMSHLLTYMSTTFASANNYFSPTKSEIEQKSITLINKEVETSHLEALVDKLNSSEYITQKAYLLKFLFGIELEKLTDLEDGHLKDEDYPELIEIINGRSNKILPVIMQSHGDHWITLILSTEIINDNNIIYKIKIFDSLGTDFENSERKLKAENRIIDSIKPFIKKFSADHSNRNPEVEIEFINNRLAQEDKIFCGIASVYNLLLELYDIKLNDKIFIQNFSNRGTLSNLYLRILLHDMLNKSSISDNDNIEAKIEHYLYALLTAKTFGLKPSVSENNITKLCTLISPDDEQSKFITDIIRNDITKLLDEQFKEIKELEKDRYNLLPIFTLCLVILTALFNLVTSYTAAHLMIAIPSLSLAGSYLIQNSLNNANEELLSHILDKKIDEFVPAKIKDEPSESLRKKEEDSLILLKEQTIYRKSN